MTVSMMNGQSANPAGVRAALIRHFFSDQLEFVNIAKNFVRVSDFKNLLKRMVFPIGSYGKLVKIRHEDDVRED